jgi:hypothetical protein
MLHPNILLSERMMEKEYGDLYFKYPRIDIDLAAVPRELIPLVPYAKFWGIVDDWQREDLVSQAPADILQNMKSTVVAFQKHWEPWLAGPEADNLVPSAEYLAFAAMVMAADSIS